MIVAVVGSRGFKRLGLIGERIYQFTRTEYGKVKIISGGASGVDEKAKYWAQNFGLEFEDEKYKPDFSGGYRKSAYADRNLKIVDDADFVICFWNGSSPGTSMVIEMCTTKRKHYEVIFD